MKNIDKIRNVVNKFGFMGLMLVSLNKVGIVSSHTVNKYKEKAYYSKMNKREQKQYIQNIYEESGLQDDLENPSTFTGKIQWMKFHEDLELRARLADKYAVREWITNKVGESYLIPIIGAWDNIEDIDFESLPDQFVFKANHGSGMNYIVKDKKKENWNVLKKKLQQWLDTSFGWNEMEMQYLLIQRKIIAETYIEQMNGNLLDYKVHCFNGKPKFIQVIGDRNLKTHEGKQANYDVFWNRLSWIFESYPAYENDISKPVNLEELLNASETLSEDFDYVRVDFYIIGDSIKFGEMTFTPAAGIYPYKGTWTKSRDLELGSYITLRNMR